MSKIIPKIIPLAVLASTLPCLGQFLQPTNPPASTSLAWNAVDNVAKYRVYWGVGSRQYTNFVESAGTNTAATVSNQTWGVTYYYAATSVASNGLESIFFSSEVSNSLPSLPAPPPNLSASNVTITVSLLESSDPKGPWVPMTNLATVVLSPGFFRSLLAVNNPAQPAQAPTAAAVSLAAPLPPMPIKVLHSPKAKGQL